MAKVTKLSNGGVGAASPEPQAHALSTALHTSEKPHRAGTKARRRSILAKGSSGSLLAGGLHVNLSPPWGREDPGAHPHTPGAKIKLEAVGGSFLLGPYPRPFHNGGKSAGLRVLGYCSLHPYPSLSQNPWGK